MEYISTKKAASLMGVTERWVQMQCKSGRIGGAIRFNERGVWMLPKETVSKLISCKSKNK